MTSTQTTDELLREVLSEHRLIHMVGASENPARDSHGVAAYMQAHGYRIVPVNPGAKQILGETAYASLAEADGATGPVRLVDVFRASDAVAGIVDEALALGTVEVLWLQLGVSDPAAEARARAGGITVVGDRCLLREHRRLL